MAGVYLLALMAGLQLEVFGLAAEITEESTGAVFVSQQAAHTVLHRQRRYNSGKLEEVLQKDNLERECMEEVCSMEEAREVFEHDERTMEFWAGYIDGDQCKPPPCQNGELTKQCSLNNGGCSHFCVMQAEHPVCKCAFGYRLGSDKKSCEPTGSFSCGHVTASSLTRSLLNPRSLNTTVSETRFNFSKIQWEDYYDDNITHMFDEDLNLPVNDSNPFNIPVASERDVRSIKSDSSPSINPALNSPEASSVTETTRTKRAAQPNFGMPTLPTITEQQNTDQRIVGGDEAAPGEIPWQVTLMSHSVSLGRAMPFCGGSLLSELWVITAAHCLFNTDGSKRTYIIRVGEWDVSKEEGPERDHTVAEEKVHSQYDFARSPYNHDIALLKLATPVELSNERRPICLGPKDFTETILRESSGSLVSGWGQIKFQGPQAYKLQKVEVPYVDRTQCKQSSRDHITRFMFCAGYPNEKKDSCQGDSGGPHATRYKNTWFLTGIVSWGEECAKDGKYGIYTRVSRYYPWISATTEIQISS
ncbi:hypothetical protein INR49_027626 [Caranx melampygus]|nr:hypothetical protein INR49_027626 [Caranx melampygus]